jgi:CubicO group peptidase (beta-lactamase class C family)
MDEIGSTAGGPGAATDRLVDEAVSSNPSMAYRRPGATLDASPVGMAAEQRQKWEEPMMEPRTRASNSRLSRRQAILLGLEMAIGAGLLTATGTAQAAAAPQPAAPAPTMPASDVRDSDLALRELGEQVRAMMARYQVPGVAVGLILGGENHAAGWGVTNVDYPLPVDTKTIFQIGSSTKPFTGAALMHLVDEGRLSLEVPVRRYLPDLALADPDVAERLTVRHLVTHTAGFFGEEVPDGGRNDDALTRMVPQLVGLPQIAPPGRVFGYNNAAVALAGRVLEVASGRPYEEAVTQLLLTPLGMERSSFFVDDLVTYPVAAGHVGGPDGPEVARPYDGGLLSRAVAPAGGLLSSVDDLLTWARFQLGDGRAADGTRLLAPETLASTHAPQGPGGALGTDDLEGVGVNWLLRRVAAVRTVEHGGTTVAQRSQFVLVPERGFAFVLLTNAPGGSAIRQHLTPWVLDHYLGLREPPLAHIVVPAGQLGEYAGAYGLRAYGAGLRVDRVADGLTLQVLGDDGQAAGPASALAFYAPDRVVETDGPLAGSRTDFLRADGGAVRWLRNRGRLWEWL